MAPAVALAPGLTSFLKSLKTNPADPSVEHLISLLKRRQIRNSRPCAIATAALISKVVGEFKGNDATRLLERIRQVGRRLTAAQPREVVVGNIVRRVLGLIREVVEDNAGGEHANNSDTGRSTPTQSQDVASSRPHLNSTISSMSPLRHAAIEPIENSNYSSDMSDSGDLTKRPPLLTSHTSYAPASTAPLVNSLFGLFSQPVESSNASTPTGPNSPDGKTPYSLNLDRLVDLTRSQPYFDLKGEVMSGIMELQEELEQSDKQIADLAHEHIHANEIILTHTASTTVQKFLAKAAKNRKFTVVHAETYPHDNAATHEVLLTGRKHDAAGTAKPQDDDDSSSSSTNRWKTLTELGIPVYVIPDSHVFAIMSRVNKVILATHTVLANGGLVAAAGAHLIAQAAKSHQTPVVVLSGVYKLSPVYPFDLDELIEYGDVGAVVPYDDGEFVDKVDVEHPLYDYVPADLVDLYITNLGGHAPSFLYRIVADHYRPEDTVL